MMNVGLYPYDLHAINIPREIDELQIYLSLTVACLFSRLLTKFLLLER